MKNFSNSLDIFWRNTGDSLAVRIVLFFFMTSAFVACEKDDSPPSIQAIESFDPAKAILLKRGTITGINHTASGTASLYEQNGNRIVYLNPFSSQDGPDLKVYFSKDAGASEYVRLGQLKSTMGAQAYTVPSQINVDDYHYVHIWCERFSVEFARAEIKL